MTAPQRPLSRRALLADGLKAGLQGTVLLSLGKADLAFGAELLAVRVWPARDYTRVTLESDTPLTARHFLMSDPLRLVIDVGGLVLSTQLRDLVRKIHADDPYIEGVRVGQYQPRIVRLVLDLKQVTKPQVFSLPPVAAYQHRMVFDLYPASEADPTLALRKPVPEDGTAPAGPPTATAQANKPATGGPARPALPPVAGLGTGGTAVAGSGALLPRPQGDKATPPLPPRADASGDAARAMNDALGDFITKLPPGTPDKSGRPLPGRPGTEPRMAELPGGDRGEAATPGAAETGAARRIVVVALDPGHGGEDPGAIGPSGLQEKDVALAIAMKVRDRINAQPGMRAMLTRDSDFFVPLQERVRKARRVQADLFISIHADAFMNPQARGASVFALSDGAASSAAARWMARKENSSDMVGGVNIKARDAQLMRTLLEMSTAAQIKDSLRLGHAVLGRLGTVGRLHKARVEQAGFAVLKAPDIPSILVETGFISNPEEEGKLRDEDYQHRLADALLNGISRYFARNPPLARSRSL